MEQFKKNFCYSEDEKKRAFYWRIRAMINPYILNDAFYSIVSRENADFDFLIRYVKKNYLIHCTRSKIEDARVTAWSDLFEYCQQMEKMDYYNQLKELTIGHDFKNIPSIKSFNMLIYKDQEFDIQTVKNNMFIIFKKV
jgi:hypothetical protein